MRHRSCARHLTSIQAEFRQSRTSPHLQKKAVLMTWSVSSPKRSPDCTLLLFQSREASFCHRPPRARKKSHWARISHTTPAVDLRFGHRLALVAFHDLHSADKDSSISQLSRQDARDKQNCAWAELSNWHVVAHARFLDRSQTARDGSCRGENQVLKKKQAATLAPCGEPTRPTLVS